jgi:hypothetical protein
MLEENKLTTIKVSLKEGFFEVSGSEDFVRSQVAHLEKVIIDYFGDSYGIADLKGAEKNARETFKKQNEFDNVFDVVDGKSILILESIPGKTKKDKMINAALLYLFGLTVFEERKEAHKKEILKVCENYGCKDSANFANHIRSAKGLFIIRGNNISITTPGVLKAKELIKK